MRALDWFNQFEDGGYYALSTDRPDIAKTNLDDGVQLWTQGGYVRTGFEAVRAIALRLPLLAPLAALLYIPPVAHVGQKLYRWYAARRPNACKVPQS